MTVLDLSAFQRQGLMSPYRAAGFYRSVSGRGRGSLPAEQLILAGGGFPPASDFRLCVGGGGFPSFDFTAHLWGKGD